MRRKNLFITFILFFIFVACASAKQYHENVLMNQDLTVTGTIIDPTITNFTSAGHDHEDATGGATVDHGLALTGLSDDDHTIYGLLLGRSGGQTLIGGTASGDDLLLQSTSNGTKGSIGFGNLSTGMVFDGTSLGLILGGSAPVASAQVEMISTTKGFLGPRMTTAERDAIGSPATGLTIYNTTTNELNFFNGSVWAAIGGVGADTDLNNLTTTSINQDLLPNVTDARNLGSTTFVWSRLHTHEISFKRAAATILGFIDADSSIALPSGNTVTIAVQNGSSAVTQGVGMFTTNSTAAAPTGNVVIDTGNQNAGFPTTQNAGDVLITAGDVTDALNAGSGGNVIIDAGTAAGAGVVGNIQLRKRVVIGSTIPSTSAALKIVSDETNSLNMLRFNNSASSGPRMNGTRARGTEATPLAILASDRLFTIRGRGFDGTDNATGIDVRFIADENFSGTNRGSHIVIRITENGTSSTVERFRFDHNGRLGIGTTNPQELLHVGDGNILIENGGIEAQRDSGNFGGSFKSGVTTSNIGHYYATNSGSQACDTTCTDEDANAGFNASSGICKDAWTSAAVVSTCATVATNQKCHCMGAN